MSLKDLFIRPENTPKNQGNNRTTNDKSTGTPRREEREDSKFSQPQPAPKEEAPVEQINMDNIIPQPDPGAEDNTSPITEVNNVKKKRLWETLIKRNLPGPDMLELKSYSASLESMGLSQEKRYEAAFKMLKAQYPDFTKEKLLKSIDTYISYVNEEIESGRNQYAAKRKQTIGTQQKNLDNMVKENNHIEQQLIELQKKNKELTNEIEKLKAEITVATKEIAHDEQVFINSANSVICDLMTDREEMSNINVDQ